MREKVESSVEQLINHCVAVLGPLNEFGYLLAKFCEQKGKSINEVARAAGFKGNSRIYYAIRSKARKGKDVALSEDELLRLAHALGLQDEEEEHLIITALLEVAATRLRIYVRRLEALKVPQRR